MVLGATLTTTQQQGALLMSFAYRYVVTCLPLMSKGYTTEIHDPNVSSVRFSYGGALTGNGTLNNYSFKSTDLDVQWYVKTIACRVLFTTTFPRRRIDFSVVRRDPPPRGQLDLYSKR
ncbi:hypothetical protein GGR57DRAFT_3005 [Xylariaceae sp. FL1272]|nr:hypothetical protein GGR57DRAFT_3005 [Xylariaceae sp. FL1272]